MIIDAQALVNLVIFGLVWYLAVTYIPMQAPVKVVVNVVCVVILCVWLLQFARGGGPITIR